MCNSGTISVYHNGSKVDTININGYGEPYTPNPVDIRCLIGIIGGTVALGLLAKGSVKAAKTAAKLSVRQLPSCRA